MRCEGCGIAVDGRGLRCGECAKPSKTPRLEPLYNGEGDPVPNVADLEAWLRSRRVKLTVSWRKCCAEHHNGEFTVTATSRRNKTHKVEVKDTSLAFAVGDVIDRMNHVLAGRP
jgi:hypothetical protein